MRNSISLDYIDRRSGTIETEQVFASSFLAWSYNNKLGRWLTACILSRPGISRIYGWLSGRKLSKYLIPLFIKRSNKIKESISYQHVTYNSFNDFFTRKLSCSERPIDSNSENLVSPSDGKLIIVQNIGCDETFQIKRNLFNLNQFLDNDNLTSEFSGGDMIIIRLSLSDYHHFSFPVSGFVYSSTHIQGRLYAGGSYSLYNLTPFFTENVREITLINSDLFGLMAQIEIGAFTVGSIRQTYPQESRIQRGDSKGYFELGGSTIVLLFKKNTLKLDFDILKNSKEGIETKVSLGEKIGCLKKEFNTTSEVRTK